MASRQLLLLTSPDRPWQLDERTKAVGRAGVARARQALSAPGGHADDRSQRSAA